MNTPVTAMEARMTAAESLAEKLQMENDGKHCDIILIEDFFVDCFCCVKYLTYKENHCNMFPPFYHNLISL